MEQERMKIQVVIFDIYSTILDVGPPPTNADALWQRLFEATLQTPPPVSRTEFSVRAARIIARQHAAARARGIQWPEIQWPSVVLEAIPSLARLAAPTLDEFLYRQMQLGRTLRLADGAEACLRQLNDDGILLGIASNAQAYTLRELTAALQAPGLNLSLFDRGLRFWSFEHGFSKPDPHVFRILTARLEARGIRPAETLMVGDRRDNDIEPARAQGWQTWQVGPAADGNWAALRDRWFLPKPEIKLKRSFRPL
ncbi:MAG: HAD family hydrolase [Verrucomicrobia subdivision 3 bacterium]|nr:HAD family hydrolase [Limisphaerales bacterium]